MTDQQPYGRPVQTQVVLVGHTDTPTQQLPRSPWAPGHQH